MRQVTRKGLICIAAAGGVLAVSGGTAHADTRGEGGGPGVPRVLSGNSVQAPVHVPVNVCGNTVNGVGLLNPAHGNTCSSNGAQADTGPGNRPDGAQSQREADDSGGTASGNRVQAPVDVPVNVCGNTVTVIGGGNSPAGNNCESGSVDNPQDPQEPEPEAPLQPESEVPERPRPEQPTSDSPQRSGPGTSVSKAAVSKAAVSKAAERRTAAKPHGELARTGGGSALGTVVPAAAGLLLGGYVLYRRGTPAGRH